jgi:serine/threonine protein kinase
MKSSLPATDGTLPYAPIAASPALDLWALGVVLFQMCTGSALFPARNDDTLDDKVPEPTTIHFVRAICCPPPC